MHLSYLVVGTTPDGSYYQRRHFVRTKAQDECARINRRGGCVRIDSQWIDGRFDDRLIWQNWQTASGRDEGRAVSVL